MAGERKRAQGPQRWLRLAFVTVTVSFVAASVYSQLVLENIDRSASSIAANASPSIERLADARADLGELQSSVLSLVRAASEGEHPSTAAVQAHRADLDSNVDRYLLLPRYEGEEHHWRQISSTVKEVEADVDNIIDLLKRDEIAAARQISMGEMRTDGERASIALRDATAFNAQHAADLALRIETRRHQTMIATIILDLICAVAATILALALSRTVRAYGEVVESRNELLERRADELEVFASRVSHDILSPLGTITLALGILQKRADKSGDRELARTTDRAIAGVDRAARIVRDLLSFARAGATPIPGETSDLGRAVRDVLDGASAEASDAEVSLETDIDSDTCSVACAPGVLTSILANLVRNAVKYMDESPVRRVVVRATRHDGNVTVDVEDTGPGIPPEMLDVIFLPHVRGATGGRPGLGLGLATVKRLVEAHGGTVSVRSTLGRGTTFSFELPSLDRTAPSTSPVLASPLA
jgi:signal transduction histidine kinase